MPFRPGSVTPKPSQASRCASGDQELPQSVSRVGSGHLNWRNVPEPGSTIVAAQVSVPSVQAVAIAPRLPSRDQRGAPQGPLENSRRSWLPSRVAVYGTVAPRVGAE